MLCTSALLLIQVADFCTSCRLPLHVEVTLVPLAEPTVPLDEGILQGPRTHVRHCMAVHGHTGQPKLVDRTPATTLQTGSSSQDKPELLGVEPAVLHCQRPVGVVQLALVALGLAVLVQAEGVGLQGWQDSWLDPEQFRLVLRRAPSLEGRGRGSIHQLGLPSVPVHGHAMTDMGARALQNALIERYSRFCQRYESYFYV